MINNGSSINGRSNYILFSVAIIIVRIAPLVDLTTIELLTEPKRYDGHCVLALGVFSSTVLYRISY